MNKIFKCCFLVFLIVLLNFDLAHAQIGEQIDQQITRILSKPLKVYKLSSKNNEHIFKVIDTFFDKHLDFRDAKEFKSENGLVSTKSLQLSKNIVFLSDKVEKYNEQLKEPVTIWYESSPQKRSFQKILRKPSRKSLSSEEVTQLAQKFINMNKFYKETSVDKISYSQVVARKLSRFNEKLKEEDKLTILQRVFFKRNFNGYEVINSKQIVDIHPETQEILSYKSIEWTPVDEASGKSYSYLSKEEIIKHMDNVLGISQNRNVVEEVESVYLQTNMMLIPVLAVSSKPIGASLENRPSEKRTLLVFLVKDLPKPEKETKLRSPKKHKKL